MSLAFPKLNAPEFRSNAQNAHVCSLRTNSQLALRCNCTPRFERRCILSLVATYLTDARPASDSVPLCATSVPTIMTGHGVLCLPAYGPFDPPATLPSHGVRGIMSGSGTYLGGVHNSTLPPIAHAPPAHAKPPAPSPILVPHPTDSSLQPTLPTASTAVSATGHGRPSVQPVLSPR